LTSEKISSASLCAFGASLCGSLTCFGHICSTPLLLELLALKSLTTRLSLLLTLLLEDVADEAEAGCKTLCKSLSHV
jgi:hypothetical protein